MIWYNDGTYMDSQEVTVGLNNPAGLFGYGVFTTVRLQYGKLFFLKEHLMRLKTSCEYFNIPFVEAEYRNVILKLSEQNANDSLRLRIIIRLIADSSSQLIITTEPLILSESPIKVMIAPKPRELCVMNRHKTTNYMLPVHFKGLATKAGFDEMLFYNSKGDVLETCFANIFFVRNRYIYTPPSDSNTLSGIIRSKLLQLAEINGYHIVEKQIPLSEISEFESAFITNSIQHIKEIASIGEYHYKPVDRDLLRMLKDSLKKLIFDSHFDSNVLTVPSVYT